MANFTYLYAVPGTKYPRTVAEIVQSVLGTSIKTCYVTLNKTHGMVGNVLNEAGLETENFYFIDGVSDSLFHQENTDNAYFLKQPLELSEIENAMNTAIKKGNTAFIFDSLSTLTTYSDQNATIQFFNNLIVKLAEQKIIIIFLCLLSDTNKDLIAHMSMCVDKVEEK